MKKNNIFTSTVILFCTSTLLLIALQSQESFDIRKVAQMFTEQDSSTTMQDSKDVTTEQPEKTTPTQFFSLENTTFILFASAIFVTLVLTIVIVLIRKLFRR